MATSMADQGGQPEPSRAKYDETSKAQNDQDNSNILWSLEKMKNQHHEIKEQATENADQRGSSNQNEEQMNDWQQRYSPSQNVNQESLNCINNRTSAEQLSDSKISGTKDRDLIITIDQKENQPDSSSQIQDQQASIHHYDSSTQDRNKCEQEELSESKEDNKQCDVSTDLEKIKAVQSQGKPCIDEHDQQEEVFHQKMMESCESKKKKPKTRKLYDFQLSPEEQELAYQLKATLLKKVQKETVQLQAEVALHQQHRQLKKQQIYSARPKPEDSLSHTNAIKLMRMYEKKAKTAEAKVKELESQLHETQNLAQRYRDQYIAKNKRGSQSCADSAKSLSARSPSARNSGISRDEPLQAKNECVSGNNSTKKDSKSKISPRHGTKIMEDDLDDDEAVFKRHVAHLANTKSINGASPIRVQDVIRKSEVLIMQNEDLKLKVARLQSENSQLLVKLRHAEAHKNQLSHNLGTSEANRKDLLKRLEKEQKQRKKLDHFLTCQATDIVLARKDAQAKDEHCKWIQIRPVSSLGAIRRTYAHPVKKNVDTPRQMYPVEKYSTG